MNVFDISRYTLDDWASFSDVSATYVPDSCDGFSDLFTFQIFGGRLEEGRRIEMAVRYQVRGAQYWDSNFGANYCFQCVPCPGGATNTAEKVKTKKIPLNT